MKHAIETIGRCHAALINC